MNHNHNHSCTCTHASVKYCSHCKTVYCEGCNQEWTLKGAWTPYYYYNGYTTTTPTYTSGSGKYLGQITTTTATPEPVSCKHGT